MLIGLGFVGFVELMAVGIALARPKKEIVIQRVHSPGVYKGGQAFLSHSKKPRAEEKTGRVRIPDVLPKRPLVISDPLPAIKLKPPPIAHAEVSRLVKEARELYIAGDLQRTIVKLEEAAKYAPNEPNVLYLFGQCYEEMGLYERAGNSYSKVYNLGTTNAGSLYELAANKLTNGFENAETVREKFSLGRSRIFRDKRVMAGERIVLTIPVLAVPNLIHDPSEIDNSLEVKVNLFDTLNGEIVPSSPTSSIINYLWRTPPTDWQDGGEELLRVTYIIPPSEFESAERPGARRYYGYSIELYFDNELLDHQASPRTLALKMNARPEPPTYYSEEYMLEDFNSDFPFLPAIK